MHVRTWMTKDSVVVEPETTLPEAHSLEMHLSGRRVREVH